MIKTLRNYGILSILTSVLLSSWYGIYQYKFHRLHQEIKLISDKTQQKLSQDEQLLLKQMAHFYQQNSLNTTDSVPQDIQQYMQYLRYRPEIESVIFSSTATKNSSVLLNPGKSFTLFPGSKADCDELINAPATFITGSLRVVPMAQRVCIYNSAKNIIFIVNPKSKINRLLPTLIHQGYFVFQWLNNNSVIEPTDVSIESSVQYLGVSYPYILSPNQAYLDTQFYHAFFIALILTIILWMFLLLNTRFKYLNDKAIHRPLYAEVSYWRKLAFYDPLTNLPNRKYFLSHLQDALDDAQKHEVYFSVCFIDCDYFKQVNDQHGHYTGDLLLQHIGNTIAKKIREDDFLARLSGDEFCLILKKCTTKKELERIIQKILDAVSMSVVIENKTISPSISIGAVIYPGEPISCEHLLAQADKAMYRAKKLGKGSYWIANPNNFTESMGLVQS